MGLISRGREVSRIESFSDAIFGFSATLLVVSLEVPEQFSDLIEDLKGFGAFGLSFLALVMIWVVHRSFFRRFPLDDKVILLLNSILLFVVLFYVYPLKYVSIGMASVLFAMEAGGVQLESLAELGQLFMLYSGGFFAIFLCVALMYRHAQSKADEYEYTEKQRLQAMFYARHYLLFCALALVSIAIASGGIGLRYGAPGFIYALLGPISYAHVIYFQKRYGKFES